MIKDTGYGILLLDVSNGIQGTMSVGFCTVVRVKDT